MSRPAESSVGIDTGGTFTDVVIRHADGRTEIRKLPSTPSDPSEAVLAGLAGIEPGPARLIHGSTVATNALLERKGARIALVTTAGFEDVLEIGRQARRSIYDLGVDRVPPLVARDDCFGVLERVGPDGDALLPLEAAEIERVVDVLTADDYEAAAICLLHAYANPAHERRLATALRQAGLPFVCASHEVLPEFREYERASTTSVNAYVGPVMDEYLGRLERQVEVPEFQIMQSNGGALDAPTARARAVETVLSGPAGGVVGAVRTGHAAGLEQLITFDMGGTSTDVSLCPGEPSLTNEASLGGLPIRVPVLDIHTVGAGGGSIAWRDAAGGLRVGPRSAGATPGPVCYGRSGTEVTVTDANVFLGRLPADCFLGGEQRLDADAAAAAVNALASSLGLPPVQLALGVLEIANSTMEAAIRVISIERGHDPRDFSLVCFGGAGGLHAVALAASLNIPRVLVPPGAGTLSAMGMLLSDTGREYSRTVLGKAAIGDPGLETALGELAALAERDLPASDLCLQRSLDLRYRGQGFELNVPWAEDPVPAFHALHERRYGYADPARTVEVVNVRVRATVPTRHELPEPARVPPPVAAVPFDTRGIFFGDTATPTGLYQRDELDPGHFVRGPAVIVEYSSTTLIPSGWTAIVDGHTNLLISPETDS